MATLAHTPYDLTRSLPGAYTYRRRGLASELFPDTFFRDAGGETGWLPFAQGAMTNDRGDFVIWDGRTVGGSGVDIVFDVGRDCWLDSVAILPVRAEAYPCGLGQVSVSVRAEQERRYHVVGAPRAGDDAPGVADPWLTLSRLDCRARFVRLRLQPGGRPTYDATGIGIVSVRLFGLTMEERQSAVAVPRLYPWPAEVAWGDGAVVLGPHSGIAAGDEDTATARMLADRIADRLGVRLPVNAAGDTGITLRRADHTPAEGYTLRADERGVLIEGDAGGLYYGAQTLLQLLHRTPDGVAAPFCTLRDEPAVAVRGLHMYLPARADLDYCKRLFDVMAELKLNTVIMEVGAGMRLSSHPEINAAWQRFAADMNGRLERGEAALAGDRVQPRRWQNSMHIELAGGSFLEQDEVRDLVRHAGQRHITVLPEVQTLSHCYWLLPAHPELAERSDTPYPDTYCPSNPAVYPLVFDVMDEVLDVFEPPAMVIGHDEAWSVGTCPACRQTSAARLIADDVARLHDHLARRQVATWMWGDTLHPNYQAWQWVRNDIGCYFRAPDTTGLLDMLSKDIVLLNWWWGEEWAPRADLLGLEQHLAAAGLRQVFANFAGASCRDFAGRASRWRIDGGVLPSWVASSERELGRNGVIANMVASANVLWSQRYGEKSEETWREVAQRLPAVRAYLSGRPSPREHADSVFAPVLLDAYANAPLADPTGTLGDYDLRGLPVGEVTLGGVPFHITDPLACRGNAAVVVQATDADEALYPSEVCAIPGGRRAAGLIFLHVASATADAVDDWRRRDSPQYMGWPAQARQTIGHYRVHYADGGVADIELCYDEHLTCWNTRYGERLTMPYQADPAWQGQTIDGTPVTVWLYEWENERDVPIAAIDVCAASGTDSALILLGVTAVQRGEDAT